MGEAVAPLDLYLRGARDYVQGTQIIARLAERLPPGDWRLDSAGFTMITRRTLCLVQEEGSGDKEICARVSFRSESGDTAAFALRPSDAEAPRRDLPMPIELARLDGDDAVARWSYAGVTSFEDTLNLIVQAIKEEHEQRWPQARDIWFTGTRRTLLPVRGAYASNGVLTLNLQRQIGASGALQTMWRTDLPTADRSGVVTFALKLAD